MAPHTGAIAPSLVPLHPGYFFYLSALLIGVVAGMRTMMAPAVLSLTLARRPELAPMMIPVQWFMLRGIAIFLGLAALGELVVDKLPSTPNRISEGPLVARIVSGAITGAAVMEMGQLSPWVGVALGAVGALIGAFGGFHARRFADHVTGIRDPFIGALEDVIAIAIAVTVIAQLVG